MARMERWLVYPVLGLLCWAVFGGAFPTRQAGAADKDARFSTVQARRFEVLDESGKLVALLGANETGGGALIVLTSKQKPAVELGVRRDSGIMTLMRHAEKSLPMVQIAADKAGRAQLAIFGDEPGTVNVVLGRDANGGKLSIRSKTGALAAGVSAGPAGTGYLAVSAGDGRAKAFMGVSENGGVMGVKDMADQQRVLLHVDETGGAVTTHKADAKK